MPLVNITYHHLMPEDYVSQIGVHLNEILPEVVAGALDVPGNKKARVLPHDIIIHHHTSVREDKNAKHIEILILSEAFPERMENIDERGERIRARVESIAAHYKLTGFVWILPIPGAWFGPFGK